MHRRTFMILGGGAVIGNTMPAFARTARLPGEAGLQEAAMSAERASGGRFGVMVMDTATRARFSYRGDERFPLCSTFKLPLVAATLYRIDRRQDRLARRVPVTRADIIAHSPFCDTRAGADASVEQLCAAAMTLGDNAAANLLLSSIGGPAGLTRWLRALGDPVTRLDRNEPTIGDGLSGDPRDTTSPAAMASLVRRFLLTDLLRPASRQCVERWMIATETGLHKIRAGLPAGWRVGDRTGTDDHGSDNDVAIVWPPRRPPLIIASYLTDSTLDAPQRSAIHAAFARALAAAT